MPLFCFFFDHLLQMEIAIPIPGVANYSAEERKTVAVKEELRNESIRRQQIDLVHNKLDQHELLISSCQNYSLVIISTGGAGGGDSGYLASWFNAWDGIDRGGTGSGMNSNVRETPNKSQQNRTGDGVETWAAEKQ